MTINKQMKITSMFKRGTQIPDDVQELQSEIEELEKQLNDKQNELFLLQRESFKQKTTQSKKKAEVFVRPEKIVLENSVISLQNDLELMGMLNGMVVTSYAAGDHCSIVYHMYHDAKHETKHGLRIELKHGINEVSKSSLPLGFNLEAVTRQYDSIMKPECLREIRNALVAYYDRLDQYEALKMLVNEEVQLFKVLDGFHMELTFAVQPADEEGGDPVTVMLVLDYDVCSMRPSSYKFKKNCMADIVLREVCEVAEAHDREMPGGEGDVVEVDETHLYTRKYHRGRLLQRQTWSFGCLSRLTKKIHVQLIPNKSRAVLDPIVEQNVRQLSFIMSDMHRAYVGIN